ncbi:hypothetical protein SAMD00023353_1900150 [Rosellinia necatrix]|uniref:Duf1740 domain containing protein n=1 Tax=Rosellinia necatrix TaxID=77044 RepID=A0A1W2TEV1_ROSNE|nr:hypothetical protein SAMD00023353_1900150 [Rosellinia necatrix]
MSSSREKGRGPAVPRFASFKPKASDATQHARETAVDDEPERAGRRVTQLGHSQVHHHPFDIDARPNLASRVSRDPPPPPPPPTRRELDGDVSHYFDRRGDALITRYGSNDRSRVPRYKRVGAGRVLGADGFMKIEKLGSREEFFIRSPHESGSLLSSDKSLSVRGIRLDSKPLRIRRRESPPGDGKATEDYLSFKPSRKRKRDGGASEESSSSDEGPSYRSIYGKSRRDGHPDSDGEYGDSDASGNAPDRSIRDPTTMRSIELSRKVREHPEDVKSWLELVDHQNTLLEVQSRAHAPTAAEVKSFADIKLSLLEQALSHHGNSEHSKRLNLKIVEEGVKVWDSKVALKKFAEVMQEYPDSFELWKLYVALFQTTLSTCHYDEIKQLYTEKLDTLGKRLHCISTAEEQIECAEQIIYVFLRLTRFLADAGFAELASAAWQASLELNLARPSTLQKTEISSSFGEYWESEVPRLGEDGWRGWAAFVTDSDAQEPPDPKSPHQLAPPTTRDGYKAWQAVEYHRAQNATIPARTLDEGAEDDPFRVVMFTDFQDILPCFPAELVPRIQPLLLDAFLIFCRLPPSLQHQDLINEATKDPFLVRNVHGIPFAHLSSRDNIAPPDDEKSKSPEFSYKIHHMYLTPEILCSSTQWFRYFERVHDIVPTDGHRWTATMLKHLTQVVGTSQLGLYTLAFESMTHPGNEKKSAKALLKQDPSNVDLYLGYAILENERGNKAVARNTISAALGLPSILPQDRVRLSIGAAWLELNEGELAKATLQLCRLVDGGPTPNNMQTHDPTEVTPSQVLKATQFLVTNRDYKISSGDIVEAVIYAEGLVLLDYLVQRSKKETSAQKQGDIWSAILRITQCSEDLASRGQQHSPAHEKFLQSSARLLYYHASHGAFRPGLLREQLTRYLSYFPSNTIFLSLFAWREERLSVNDRVRALLRDHVLTRANESLSSHVFAIAHELRAGNAHSARAAFERALGPGAPAHHHPGLWVAYVRFCHARRELRPKARAVFHRAVQACPWSKDVFMEAFATLPREMDSAELKGVYSTMCEKGLRVHVDMDEFVEKWRREAKESKKEKGVRSRK